MNNNPKPEAKTDSVQPGLSPAILLGRKIRSGANRFNYSGLPDLLTALRLQFGHLRLVSHLLLRIQFLKAVNLFQVMWYPCELLLWRVILDIRFVFHFTLFWLFGIYVVENVQQRPNPQAETPRKHDL